MSRKNTVIKCGAVHRIREGSRLMRTHETMVDLINGRHPGGSIMDVLSSGLLGLDFLRGYEQPLDDDLIYSDEDDDDYDDDIGNQFAKNKPLEPHPRIRQLTEEEADKHAQELIAEEERRKERMERNKRKKLRKKEKKRLEKENAAKENLLEEEQEKSDSSENREEKNNISEKKMEETDSLDKPTKETTLCDEDMIDIKEDKNREKLDTKKEEQEENLDEIVKAEEKEHLATMNKDKEDILEIKNGKPVEITNEENKKDFNNSVNSSAKSVQKETSTQMPARERKKEKNKEPEIPQQQQNKEEKTKVVEKPKHIQKREEKHEPNKEQETTEANVEEFARKSRELAGIGNRLAASGQYEMAVKYFTEAIKFNPQEFKLFGNRSLCYERMQQCENALRDADLALCMQPNWIKGLFRKGKALCGLKRYYEASLIYKEVLNLESTSIEAMQELKRAQTLHLMEMGFSWAQSSEALKTHGTLEEAVDALFSGNPHQAPAAAHSVRDTEEQPVGEKKENMEEEEEWTNVGQTSRSRTQQIRESEALGQVRSKSQSPTPNSRNSTKPELFSIWVGSLAPTLTYVTLHELFSRAGTVHSIKMLLEHQCAFVNYTRKGDCDRAIQCINGLVVEGAPLAVRYPNRAIHAAMAKPPNPDMISRPGPYKKECFFWRTTGCTRTDCTFKHVPENKNVDKEKFTSRLGNANM